jgi:hypothetical protein
MKTMIFTLSRDNYKSLRDITSPNKIEYCQKHGYIFQERNDNFKFENLGFEKIYRILEILEEKQCDILYWCGTDTLITNYNIKITDLIDIEHDFFIATDANNINADSFIIKNTIDAREFFLRIINSYPQYAHHCWAEQQVIIDLITQNEHYKNITKILPQKIINCYDYSIYPNSNFSGAIDRLRNKQDFYGNYGQWEKGDFLIHWPATNLDQRLNLTKKYIPLIIK